MLTVLATMGYHGQYISQYIWTVYKATFTIVFLFSYFNMEDYRD